MKKFKLGTLLLSVGLLCACTHDTGEVRNEKFEVIDKLQDKVTGTYDVVRDKETGCVYLMYTYGLEATPYYDEDGNVMGCGIEKEDFKY